MNNYLCAFLTSLGTMTVLDAAWLGLIAPAFYIKHVGFIMADKPNWIATIAFYSIFILGVTVFVVYPSWTNADSIAKIGLLGALFGHVMSKGLWQYSRHPNYFGEVTQWWAIGVVALTCSYSWLGLIGPLVITYLIVKVSGVPLHENIYKDSPNYQAYTLRTSILIPLPPKGKI